MTPLQGPFLLAAKVQKEAGQALSEGLCWASAVKWPKVTSTHISLAKACHMANLKVKGKKIYRSPPPLSRQWQIGAHGSDYNS